MSSGKTSEILGVRLFTAQDQDAFAAISLDRNPMHVDKVAARRLLTGQQVVHGIHTLLAGLDLLCARGSHPPRSVDCTFANPVNVGDTVVFSLDEPRGEKPRLIASVNGLTCTEVRLDFTTAGPSPAPDDPALREVRYVDAAEPLDESPGSQVGLFFEIQISGASPIEEFPHVCQVLGVDVVSAIARLSYFVGMICPGLHSVFSLARFDISPTSTEKVGPLFEVKRYDPRFRLFICAFTGVINGEIRAFLRPPPHAQPTSAELLNHVERGEFDGVDALVIGGSRGLGELTAKLIAAGGANVTITYAAGRQDAQRICDEVSATGFGHCRAMPLDLRAADFAAIESIASFPQAVFYFATPRIFTKRSEVFDRPAFDEFVLFYLQRFFELCLWLEQRSDGKAVRVYLPSTVFITNRPRGMTEYAMAKAAAEVMVDDLNRTLVNVKAIHTRLPRLATDQTASILEVSTESSEQSMLEVVRLTIAGVRDL